MSLDKVNFVSKNDAINNNVNIITRFNFTNHINFIEENTEEYDAIVLEPAEEGVIEEESIEESVEEELELPEVIQESVQQIEQTVAKPAEVETSNSKYIVPSLNDLKKGNYYVQISVLKSDEAIMEIINKYSKNYPITVVPAANGSKQVMVGPLSIDEYGTVLARFKAYGYKDAFVRKVK